MSARLYQGELLAGDSLRLVLYATIAGIEVEARHLHGTAWVTEDVEHIGHPASLARYLEHAARVPSLVVAVVQAWAEARRMRDGMMTVTAEWAEIPEAAADVAEHLS